MVWFRVVLCGAVDPRAESREVPGGAGGHSPVECCEVLLSVVSVVECVGWSPQL